jgi:type I restriction enzyme, S subunit
MEVRPLGDLLDTLIDYRGKTPQKTDSGVPLITAKVIKGGRIVSDNLEFIAEEAYEGWMRRGLPKSGDILITTEAPLGEVAQIGEDAKVALAQRVILLRPDRRRVDRQFLFHYLRSPEAQARLRRRASGTTVSGIRQPELRAVEITLLARSDQEQVGQILDTLDCLIENNGRRIELLERIAQAIYREWFVRFRYPGHEKGTLVDSSLGPIPENWEVKTIGDVALVNAQSRKPDSREQIRYLDISALGDRTLTTPRAMSGADAPGRARRIVHPGDVVWSMVRPGRRAHALLVDPSPNWIASTGLAVLCPSETSSALLFERVSAPEFSDYLVSQEGGSAYPAVKPESFGSATFLMPTPEIAGAFDRAVAPLHSEAWRLRCTSDQVAAISDLLLPRLVTGQIDVSSLDLDAMVESVA